MRTITTASLALLFWMLAAVLVAMAHAALDAISPAIGAATAIAALLASSYFYTRIAARNAGITHALALGIAWLVLAIVAELTVSGQLGHNWYGLLGSPDRPLLRNVSLFAWIFTPSLTA
jgi:hypothetical protein